MTDSLAAVIHKTGGLDLLTAEKDTCPFLDEKCCLYVSDYKSEVVRMWANYKEETRID